MVSGDGFGVTLHHNFVETLINVYDFLKRATCVWIEKNHIQLNVEAIGIRAEFAKICSRILRSSD